MVKGIKTRNISKRQLYSSHLYWLVCISCVRFHLCASRGRLDCLEVIISHGADVSVTDGAGMIPDYGKHVINMLYSLSLCQICKHIFLFSVCNLLTTGFSALHLAAKNSQHECLKRLLQVKISDRSCKEKMLPNLIVWCFVWRLRRDWR